MIVFSDTFTVGADVNINAYPGTPDYSMAQGAAADIKVIASTDRATTQPNSVDAMARIINVLAPTGDQEITGDVNDAGSSDGGSLGLRVAAATADFYTAYVDGSQANEVRIDRWGAGAAVTIASADRGLAASGTHSIRARAKDTATVNLEVQVDGTAILTFADSAADRKQSGRPGVGGFSVVGSAWVDNISVDDLVVGVAPRLVPIHMRGPFSRPKFPKPRWRAPEELVSAPPPSTVTYPELERIIRGVARGVIIGAR